MPRGEHPNSKANLEKRKLFDHESALKAKKKSDEAKIRKGQLADYIKVWLETPMDVKDKKTGEVETMTGAEMMLKVAIREMSKGNPKFWALMRDTAGQKPVEKVMVENVEQATIDDVEDFLNAD